jgi:hypothetical protein
MPLSTAVPEKWADLKVRAYTNGSDYLPDH